MGYSPWGCKESDTTEWLSTAQQGASVVSDSATLWTIACQAPSSWDSPGKNTGVGCHVLFQGIFPTQRLNPHLLCLLHWQVGSFTTSTTWEAPLYAYMALNYICCCSVTQSSLTICNPMDCSTPGFPVLHCLLGLLKIMSIESVMPSNLLILCCPLLPPIFPSIRVLSKELALCIRWPKYWSFSFSISPSNE